jgi:hypothetical protein
MSRPVEVVVTAATDKKPAVIGTKYTDEIGGYGVCAEVYILEKWLYLEGDPYDNRFMIDVETIPALIKELQRLQGILDRQTQIGGD